MLSEASSAIRGHWPVGELACLTTTHAAVTGAAPEPTAIPSQASPPLQPLHADSHDVFPAQHAPIEGLGGRVVRVEGAGADGGDRAVPVPGRVIRPQCCLPASRGRAPVRPQAEFEDLPTVDHRVHAAHAPRGPQPQPQGDVKRRGDCCQLRSRRNQGEVLRAPGDDADLQMLEVQAAESGDGGVPDLLQPLLQQRHVGPARAYDAAADPRLSDLDGSLLHH
mmetsp:Transcript_36019/g.95099  ORF Transcript_36019/g.95099 Transcript_36019/m.95099 type:complete len:222 (-) Transcript_36019:847-1512(-)